MVYDSSTTYAQREALRRVRDDYEAELARLRSENDALLAWSRRAYNAMVSYDEAVMVSVVMDAPPQVQAREVEP
jgi:hypothetical protein